MKSAESEVERLQKWLRKHRDRCRVCAYHQLGEGDECLRAQKHAAALWTLAGEYRQARAR